MRYSVKHEQGTILWNRCYISQTQTRDTSLVFLVFLSSRGAKSYLQGYLVRNVTQIVRSGQDDQLVAAVDKERLHIENSGPFIDINLALPKKFSGAKLFNASDAISVHHVLCF